MEPMTFPTPGPVSIHLTVAVGNVHVREQHGQVNLHITGEKDTDQVSVEHSVGPDGSLHLNVTENHRRIAAWKRRKGLTIAISTPPTTTLVADGAALSVRSDTSLEGIRLTSATGSAQLVDVTGDVDVKGAAGDVQAGRVGGHLTAHLASGDVRATAVSGGASVRTASGDVALGTLTGDSSVSSLSGDVEVASAGAGALSVHVVSGDVSIGIAGGVGAVLDVSTLSGSTRSDLEVSQQPSDVAGPQLDLKVNTLSGDIRIKPADDEAAA